MKTLTELEYYCNQTKPVGALLLTGEWGCGKTYLIEHQLRDKLNESHIIIRVSLFGICSINEIHKAIKLAYIEGLGGIRNKAFTFHRFASKFSGFTKAIPEPVSKGLLGGLLSIDYLSLVKTETIINNKRIVLVFDDLERSRLNVTDILGTINEYCENKGFHVIIIADQNKLNKSQSNEDELTYERIKEKVIYQTIQHSPSHTQIVESIIGERDNSEYKDYLRTNENSIASLFAIDGNPCPSLNSIIIEHKKRHQRSDSEQEEAEDKVLRPHNIRSLKAALQDFERIYILLKANHVREIDPWLISFIAFYLPARANQITKDKEYGYIFVTDFLNLLYPECYNPRYFPDCLCDWVLNGVWKEESLVNYIKEYYKDENDTPTDRVKTTRIDWLEESVAIEGMHNLIQEAYNGQLTFDQYIVFVSNARLAREYKLGIPPIGWHKVQDAINKKIEKMTAAGEEEDDYRIREYISESNGYSDDEWCTYQIIAELRKNHTLYIEKCRKEYIDGIVNGTEAVLRYPMDKRFNRFDKEMADATFKGFINASIPEKGQFPRYFKNVWGNYYQSFDITGKNTETTTEGLCSLKNKLKALEKQYNDKNEVFKRSITSAFIETLEEITSKDQEKAPE